MTALKKTSVYCSDSCVLFFFVLSSSFPSSANLTIATAWTTRVFTSQLSNVGMPTVLYEFYFVRISRHYVSKAQRNYNASSQHTTTTATIAKKKKKTSIINSDNGAAASDDSKDKRSTLKRKKKKRQLCTFGKATKNTTTNKKSIQAAVPQKKKKKHEMRFEDANY